MHSQLPEHFECYLRGFLHSLFQQGYDEQDASEELFKLTGEEYFTVQKIKEHYQLLKDGNYLINVRADEMKREEPEKGWFSKVTSWAYSFSGYFGYKEEDERPLLTSYLEPAPRNDIIVNNLSMVIGADYLEVRMEGTKRLYRNVGANCVVTCEEEDTVITDIDYLIIVSRDLREFFANKDLKILNWSVVPYDWDPWENPLFSSNQYEIYKIIDNIFRCIGHHTRVEHFHWKGNRILELKYFIPYLWPRILKRIHIEASSQDMTRQEESLLELEQVKRAERVCLSEINYDWYKLYKNLATCENFSICQTAPIDQTIYQEIVSTLLKNPKLCKLAIQLKSSIHQLFSLFTTQKDSYGKVIRDWKVYNYESERHRGKELWVNIDGNVLIITGPGYDEPPMTCFPEIL